MKALGQCTPPCPQNQPPQWLPWARPLCLHPVSRAVGPQSSNTTRTSRQASNQVATAEARGGAGLSADEDHQLYSIMTCSFVPSSHPCSYNPYQSSMQLLLSLVLLLSAIFFSISMKPLFFFLILCEFHLMHLSATLLPIHSYRPFTLATSRTK